MTMVPKECVAGRVDGDGTLLLSGFTGAAANSLGFLARLAATRAAA